jgi:hypothetical protein
MKNIVFSLVMLCSLETAQHFEGTHSLHLHSCRAANQETKWQA